MPVTETKTNWDNIEKNEFIRPFLSPSFDVAAEVTSLLGTTSSAVQTLNGYIASIDQQIHSNVSTHHEDLLAQTSNVELMESVVQSCQRKANTCFVSVDKVKSRLDHLHQECELNVKYLENLYKANEALRRLKSVIEIDKKANNMGNTADVATCIQQIETLCSQEPYLQVLQPFHSRASSLRQNIEKQTENMIIQGINASSIPQVSNCIQIFVNLDVLESKLSKVFGDVEKGIEKDVKAALDVKIRIPSHAQSKGPGRATAPSNAAVISKLWGNLETLSSQIINHAGKVKLVWQCVCDGRDSTSNMEFLDFIPNGDTHWLKFWNNFIDLLIRHFAQVKEDFIKSSFENDFPKLLKFFTDLGEKIEDGAVNLSVQPGLRGVISNYEKAYLSKSLAKLFDSVSHIFSSVPSFSDLDLVIQLIKSEMKVEDHMLQKLAERNLFKTVKMVCVKAEQLLVNDGNATQVIGPPTESQKSNAQVINALDYFKSHLKESKEPCEGIEQLINNSLLPLRNAIGDAIEAIVLTIHQENFQRTNKATEYSLYMGELQSFISRASKDYFALYNCTSVIHKCGAYLATKTIDLFTRHVCLLPSLHLETTRNQILVDLSHLEIALTPICPVLSEIGKPYKLLKGFKTLLALKMDEIVNSSLVGSVVSYSLAIHILFKFGHGKMKLPYVMNRWSVTRYNKWLDEHEDELERLKLLKSVLALYVEQVKEKGEQEFAPVYPHMMTLLQKGLQT